jgi:hypothetical protein
MPTTGYFAGGSNGPIDRRAILRAFERREEDAGDFAVDCLLV